MIYELFRINSEKYADIAQSVERILGKDEVTGSNPVISSMKKDIPSGCPFFISCRTGFDDIRGPRRAPRGGERRSRDTRTRHTYRICLPSTANDDEVISSMKKDIPSGCPFSYAVGTDLVIFGVHNSPIRCKGFGLFISP